MKNSAGAVVMRYESPQFTRPIGDDTELFMPGVNGITDHTNTDLAWQPLSSLTISAPLSPSCRVGICRTADRPPYGGRRACSAPERSGRSVLVPPLRGRLHEGEIVTDLRLTNLGVTSLGGAFHGEGGIADQHVVLFRDQGVQACSGAKSMRCKASSLSSGIELGTFVGCMLDAERDQFVKVVVQGFSNDHAMNGHGVDAMVSVP